MHIVWYSNKWLWSIVIQIQQFFCEEMNSSNYRSAAQGHRIGSASNRDLTQKLTYQQLLNLNHDLSKENLQLKNIGNRLGNQLRALHNQFQIKPREENVQLYTAINVHPILHQYELTLIPLLDAYEAKIQEFQNGFETINQQFINLEKKYEEVVSDNQKLRTSLTQKTIQLIDAYKNTSLQKVGSDFQQIILQQINQKQKFLATQNSRLEREYQKYKSQADKSARQLGDYKRKYEESSKSVNVLSSSQNHLEKQVKFLKQSNFKSQMELRELEGEKKKITDELERAQSQISLLNKDRDGLIRSFQSLKNDYEKMGSLQGYEQKQSYDSKQKISIHESSQQENDDAFKKLTKLQKQYDSILKQRNKLREQLQQSRVTLQQTNERLVQMKKKLDTSNSQKNTLEMSELKSKKMLVQLAQKSKNDLEQLKREHQDQMRRVEQQNYSKLQTKIKKIGQIQQLLERVKLQRDKLEQQNIIHTTLNQQNKQSNRSKDGERAVEKLKEKLAINEELFKQQIHIIENDNIYLKKENDKYKAEAKDRNDQIRKLKQQLERIKKQLADVNEQKIIMIEEIKRIKNDYEGNLRDKERLFDQKIREIKLVVQQSDKRRKGDKEKAVQAARQYKRVLQQIKNAYEQRIRTLEGQTAGYGGKSKKIDSY